VSTRALLLFCALAYAISWSLQFAAIHAVGNLESMAAAPYLVGAMAVPGFLTLAFAWFSRAAGASILWRPSRRLLPFGVIAFLVPTAIAFATVAAVMLAGWGKPGWFLFSHSGVAISGGPWLLGRGGQAWPLFVANVVLTGGAYAMFNAIFAAGEELGWRGFLQGHFIARFGTTRGVVLLGLLWSFWHLPALLAGYNFPEHPVLGGFILFPAELVAISFFLAWLTLRSGSFWAAAIAHGAGNSIEEGVVANLHLTVPHLYEDLLRLAATVVVGLVFWLLLAVRTRRVSALHRDDDGPVNSRATLQPVWPARERF